MVERRRLRLAAFSPLPPARSGIADYSAALLPALARRAELTVYAPDPEGVSATVRQRHNVRPAAAYEDERWEHDVALYQMGNSTHHEAVYKMALRYPGVVVLHDVGLHHFVAHRTIGRGEYAGFVREMGYSLGVEGVRQAWAIRYGEMDHPLTEVPLNDRLVDASLGVLVHSGHAQRLLQRDHPQRPVYVVPHLRLDDGDGTQRPELPWSGHAWPRHVIVFGSFGQITAAKRVEDALRAFARLRASVPEARYLIAGEAQDDANLEAVLAELDLEEEVFCTGYVEDLEAFAGWIERADVVVNLRHPTVGETSGTALRALGAGRPVIVYDHGWYGELPDDVALKVPPLDQEALLAAMRRLAEDPEERRRRGERGRAYVAEQHHPDKAAGAYVSAINEILEDVSGESARA